MNHNFSEQSASGFHQVPWATHGLWADPLVATKHARESGGSTPCSRCQAGHQINPQILLFGLALCGFLSMGVSHAEGTVPKIVPDTMHENKVGDLAAPASTSHSKSHSDPLDQQDPVVNSPRSRPAQLKLLSRVSAADMRVPQYLLSAIHSQEGQMALGLDTAELDWLETQFRELDGTWWRSRLLPTEQQRQAVAQVETQLWERLSKRWPTERLQRLQGLELQAQSGRALLRPDLAAAIELTSEQRTEIDRVVATTDQLLEQRLAQSQAGESTSDLDIKIREQQSSEPKAIIALLNANQRRSLQSYLGEATDLSQARRVYPMAPEFAEDAVWLAESTGPWENLRGKVVLVHFYAFQCINCQRNFHHYNAWAEKWKDRGVVVVGIQTPETRAEKDITLVKAAAENDQFQFPVLMDSENTHWDRWGNTMWPTVYVVDQRGYIRMWWQGELNWQGATGDQTIEGLVDSLLQEKK